MASNFDTTQWSLVLDAARSQAPGARDALAGLCRSYWQPLYAYARRWGLGPDDAEDLTQEFFSELIEKRTLRGVERERGRFRSYLLACFKHFLADERDRARAKKRGGGRVFLALDVAALEQQMPSALVDKVTPEALFERRWALAALESALEDVRREYAANGAEPLFEALRDTLVGGSDRPYRAVAESLGMSEGAVKVAAHRLRKRFTRVLRSQVARTVEPQEVDEELKYLVAVLAS